MIRFYIGIRDKLIKGEYEFLQKEFDLPSACTFAQYCLIGGHELDGLLFTVLNSKQHECNLADEFNDSGRMVSLKFDACHICDKVRYNPHTNKLVGFSYNAFDKNVLLEDLYKLSSTKVDDNKSVVAKDKAK